MEIEHSKTKHTLNLDEGQGNNLVNEAHAILSEKKNSASNTRSLVILYMWMFLFIFTVIMGMTSETTIYSQLSFATAIVAALGVARVTQ